MLMTRSKWSTTTTPILAKMKKQSRTTFPQPQNLSSESWSSPPLYFLTLFRLLSPLLCLPSPSFSLLVYSSCLRSPGDVGSFDNVDASQAQQPGPRTRKFGSYSSVQFSTVALLGKLQQHKWQCCPMTPHVSPVWSVQGRVSTNSRNCYQNYFFDPIL